MIFKHFFVLIVLLSICFRPGTAFPNEDDSSFVADPGVVSFTFRYQFEEDFEQTLDRINEMGFSIIEFSNLFGKSAKEVRALLDEREMRCSSFGVGYDDAVNKTQDVIQKAKILGAKHVRVAWIPHEAPFSVDDVMRAVADFNRAGQQFHQAGIRFAYHNHGYEFSPHNNGTLFDLLVSKTVPEYVSFQMDAFWVAHPGHDPVALLETYPDRFISLHLKDLRKGAHGDYSGRAPADYDVPLGEGQVDFVGLIRAAKRSSVVYMFIEDETEAVLDRVPRSRKYMLDLIK